MSLRYRLRSRAIPVIAGIEVERGSGFHGLWGAYFHDVACVCDHYNRGSHEPHFHVDGGIRAYPEWVLQPRQCDEIDVYRIKAREKAVAETDRTAPENAGLLGGASSAPDHTTMEERA